MSNECDDRMLMGESQSSQWRGGRLLRPAREASVP
jgi:hypothetical protein